MSEAHWYYLHEGQRIGPITQEQIVEVFRSGAMPLETMVRSELFGYWVPASTIERIVSMIWATAHTADAAPPALRDTRVLLDADLAILGAAPQRYARYAADIRKEYAWVPEADYRAGRAGILERFLARQRIYYHPSMDEAAARRNLAREIAALR